MQVVVVLLTSVAVYVWVVVPTGNNEPVVRPAVCVTTTPVQLSVADGFKNVTLAPHLSTSLPTTMFDGQLVKVGGTLSSIVTMLEQVVTLPLLSVTVYVTVTLLPLIWPKSVPATGFCVTLATPQLSVAVNWLVIDGITSSQSLTETLDGQTVIVGAVTSRTVTVATQMLVLPAPSVTVNVMVLSPMFEQV
jgi:hypothetical protein